MNPCPCGLRQRPSARMQLHAGTAAEISQQNFRPIAGPFRFAAGGGACYLSGAAPYSGRRKLCHYPAKGYGRQRAACQKRFARSDTTQNGSMTAAEIQQYCQLDASSRKFLEQAFQKLGLSARAHNRILKVARTIADLANSERIQLPHLAEAINTAPSTKSSGDSNSKQRKQRISALPKPKSLDRLPLRLCFISGAGRTVVETTCDEGGMGQALR